MVSPLFTVNVHKKLVKKSADHITPRKIVELAGENSFLEESSFSLPSSFSFALSFFLLWNILSLTSWQPGPKLLEIKCELILKYQQRLNFKLTYLQWNYACWLPSSSGKLTVTIIGVIMQFPCKNHIGFITVYINCHKYQL